MTKLGKQGMTHAARGPGAASLTGNRQMLLLAAAVVVVLAAALAAAVLLRGRGLTPTHMVSITTQPGVEYQPALSPDGQLVAFAAGPAGAPRLTVAPATAGGSARQLRAEPGWSEESPSWAPAGEVVRFRACRAGECTWSQVASGGGAGGAAELPPRARSAPAVAWSADGARVAFVARDTIYVAAAVAAAVQRVAVHTARYYALHSLAWSPDGERLAYVNGNPQWHASGDLAGSGIYVVPAAGGEPRAIASEDGLNVSPAWLDDGHLLFVSNRDGPRRLYVVAVGARGARGRPRAIAGIADPHSVSYAPAAGRLAWANFRLRRNIWAYPLGSAAPVSIASGEPVTDGSELIGRHDVAPDGRTLAFDSDRGGSLDLYRTALGEDVALPLAAGPAGEFWPSWSPDGRELAFSAEDSACVGGLDELMVMPADGGAATRLTCSLGWDESPAWSPDGLSIAFVSYRTGRGELWAISRETAGGAWGDPVQVTDFGAGTTFDWTPTGRELLVARGRTELILITPDGQVLSRYDLLGSHGLTRLGDVRYASDGRTIYLGAVRQDGREGIWAVPVGGGAARLLIAFDDPAVAAAGGGFISVGPDRLYLTVSQFESDIWVADLRD